MMPLVAGSGQLLGAAAARGFAWPNLLAFLLRSLNEVQVRKDLRGCEAGGYQSDSKYVDSGCF